MVRQTHGLVLLCALATACGVEPITDCDPKNNVLPICSFKNPEDIVPIPGYGDALSNRCDGLIELRDVDRALAACRQVTEFLPDDPDTFYNLAGAYALANRIDEALDALERDFTLGDTDHEYLASGPWFEPLREDPRFTSLLDRMKRAASEEAGG